MTVYRFSLSSRLTLWIAGVIILMLAGSYLITATVVERGLEDLLSQRLAYAGHAVKNYNDWHLVTRQTKTETLAKSPRFLAAVGTGDSVTVSAEADQYRLLVEADILQINNPAGSTLAASGDTTDVRQYPQIETTGFSDTVLAADLDGRLFELFVLEIVTDDGFGLGQMTLGYRLDRSMLKDIADLTGFDVRIDIGDLSAITENSLFERMDEETIASIREREEGKLFHLEANGEKLLGLSEYLPQLGARLTLVTSIEQHIDPILGSQLQRMFLLALIAGLLAIGLIYVFTSRRIGRQVGQLVDATERIARDELHFQLQPLSNDEFGAIAVQLNLMKEELLKNRDELKAAHLEQMRAERMVTIGQLATGIIHDFKNPIGVIRGTAELIPEKLHKPERVQKYCRTIMDQVDRVVALTRDILDYARGEKALELEVISVSKFLEGICAFHVSALAGNNIKIELLRTREGQVRIDPGRMQRVLDNLIVNASEAVKSDGEIRVGWEQDDNSLTLFVTDNGPGIPKEIVDTIFEPFVTQGKSSGTGLGLAISAKIVEDHGGMILVESVADVGTTFRIVIPGASINEVRNADRKEENYYV